MKIKTQYIAIALLLSPSLAFANNGTVNAQTEQPAAVMMSAANPMANGPSSQPMMQTYMVAPQAMMQQYPGMHHGVVIISPSTANYPDNAMMQGYSNGQNMMQQQPMMQHYMMRSAQPMMNGQPMSAMMVNQNNAIGGFVGPQHIVDSISAAQKANNETPVQLTGYIVASLGNNQYQFKDDSGTITLDISPESFNGITVTPDTKITLQGDVDKEWGNCIIDVDGLSLA